VQAQCEIKVVPQFANAETTDNLVDLFGSTETFIEILDAVEAAGDFADAADAVRHLTEETPNALSPIIESAIDKTNPDNLDSGLAPKNLAELAAKLKTMAEGHDVGWEVYVKLNWSICAWGCIHNSWEPHPAKAWTKIPTGGDIDDQNSVSQVFLNAFAVGRTVCAKYKAMMEHYERGPMPNARVVRSAPFTEQLC
jgi:hypothetical protein